MNISRCNRCNPNTRCRGDHREKCKGFKPPHDTWKLAELALAHPAGLSEVLLALPFEVNVGVYIGRKR